MKLPRRAPSLAALAVVPLVAACAAAAADHVARARDVSSLTAQNDPTEIVLLPHPSSGGVAASRGTHHPRARVR
jgi:hypothetical protein